MAVSAKEARVDVLLTKTAVDFLNKESKFVADLILPTLTVQQETGIYFKYEQADLRHEDDSRAPGAKSKETTYDLTQVPYGPLPSRALKNKVTDELGRQMGQTLAEKNATVRTIQKLLIAKERRLASQMADTAVITQNTTLSGTSQWSDYTNSDPVANIFTARSAVNSGCMNEPNTLLLGYEVWQKLRNHPDLVNRINGLKEALSIEQMKSIFEVDNIIVANTQYNTTRQGAAKSMSQIWGKHAWLLYINPGAPQEIDSITLGHTLRLEGEGMDRTIVKKWYDEDAESTWVRASMKYDQKFMAVECAYLIKDAVA